MIVEVYGDMTTLVVTYFGLRLRCFRLTTSGQLTMFSHAVEPLSPFRLGVLLAVARVPRYESTVLELLRKRLQRFARFLHACLTSPWLQHQVSANQAVGNLAPGLVRTCSPACFGSCA